MADIQTFPSYDQLQYYKRGWPEFMFPNEVPYAVELPGFFDAQTCDSIISFMAHQPEGKAKDCNAHTTHQYLMSAPQLDVVADLVYRINTLYYGYRVSSRYATWMQTYVEGSDYSEHMDGSPGQMRKLTGVVQLSPPENYDGGDLDLHVEPHHFFASRKRGTLVVFQPWILHKVLPVTEGIRRTINMGFWGPNFV